MRQPRYATIRIHSLTTGTGEVIRNFETRQDFELFWCSWGLGFPVPTIGVGAMGNGLIGLSYKIYRDESHNPRTLESRLLEYKNHLHLKRGEPIQLHAFNSWKQL